MNKIYIKKAVYDFNRSLGLSAIKPSPPVGLLVNKLAIIPMPAPVPTSLAALAPTLNRVGPDGYILLIKSVAIFPAFCVQRQIDV